MASSREISEFGSTPGMFTFPGVLEMATGFALQNEHVMGI